MTGCTTLKMVCSTCFAKYGEPTVHRLISREDYANSDRALLKLHGTVSVARQRRDHLQVKVDRLLDREVHGTVFE